MSVLGKTVRLKCARLDFDRSRRIGFAETVLGSGKTPEQLAEIFQVHIARKCPCLATRCSVQQVAFLRHAKIPIVWHALSHTIVTRALRNPSRSGRIVVVTGGTADLPVAEEAVHTLRYFGFTVTRCFDVGIAGLHRLLACVPVLRRADVVIAVAGMEGALPSVVTGLVSCPVVGLPTSVGYGTGANGYAALLSMLNSCAEGLVTVNIDNGFGAALAAARICASRYD